MILACNSLFSSLCEILVIRVDALYLGYGLTRGAVLRVSPDPRRLVMARLNWSLQSVNSAEEQGSVAIPCDGLLTGSKEEIGDF